MDILRSKHVDRNKTNANFQLFFLAGWVSGFIRDYVGLTCESQVGWEL